MISFSHKEDSYQPPIIVCKLFCKINKFLPGTHIPVFDELEIKISKPDYVIILPWNLKDEISTQLNYITEWGGKFLIAIPNLQII